MFEFLRRRRVSPTEFSRNPGAARLLEHCLKRAEQDPSELVVVVPKLIPSFLDMADPTERGKLFVALVKHLRHGEDVERFVRALFKGVSADKAVRYAAIGNRTKRLPCGDVQIAVRSVAEARLAGVAHPIGADVIDWLKGLGPDAVLYEIGAGIGIASLIAVGQPARPRAVAFEAAYFNFAALCENIVVNKCVDRVTPIHAALTDRTGIGEFFCRVVERGTGEHAFGRPVNRGGNPFEPEAVLMVPGLRLDDAVAMFRLPPPTHLLIHVDGAEGAVLRGAESCLRGGAVQGMLIAPQAVPAQALEVDRLLERSGWSETERAGTVGEMREFHRR